MSGKPRSAGWPRCFWAKTRRDENGCLTWTGCVKANGYGHSWNGFDKSEQAHRIAYELAVGPIPAGLHLDHLCRNRRCVEPTHLEPVTQAENRRRGLWGDMRTECKNGHPYDEENTRLRGQGGGRICRACDRERMAAYPAARKVATA